jgi:diguanylate cyclase (GGDEF)-like protein
MESHDGDLKDKYKEEFLKLKDEFETYQSFAESTIQMITEKNIKLEKKLDSIINIVEISKYINSYLSDKNLIPMINDMIIGILGATYSSIYIVDNDCLVVKATNVENKNYNFCNDEYKELFNGKAFIINCKDTIFSKETLKSEIHSVIGVPIYLREKFMGYILVEHGLNNFFGHEHIKFISTIANQIAIALENNALYNRIRELAIRDPLLGIYNRKYFFETVEDVLCKNPMEAIAFAMMDLDNFKQVNDKYGHQFGDKVLIQTTNVILDNIDDKNDLVARYGGEEIIICIRKVTDIEEVYKKIDNIRVKISENVVRYKDIEQKITASFGISYYPIDGANINEMISVADSRLYAAKKKGKNKVIDK